MEQQPTRFMNAELPAALRQAADDLGRIGAGGRDIAFIDNATTACNAVLRSLNFQPRDEVLMHVSAPCATPCASSRNRPEP